MKLGKLNQRLRAFFENWRLILKSFHPVFWSAFPQPSHGEYLRSVFLCVMVAVSGLAANTGGGT